MNRRKFLGGAAALGAAAAAWPELVRSAFAAGPECKPGDGAEAAEALVVLSAAYRRAQRAGKPLLTLIVPAEEAKQYERGRAFGELLNHGGDAELAPLALCEVACARMAVLRRLVPAAGAGEPLMVLCETDRTPAAGLRLDAQLPDDEGELDMEGARDWRKALLDSRRHEEAAVTRRIATLARLCREALAGDGAMLGRRLAQLKARGGEEVAQVEALLAQGQAPQGALADRAAALLAVAALAEKGARRERLLGALAEATRRRLTRQRVPGSRWARSSGCGTDVEGVEDRMIVSCGMGHVPEKSARFLYYFNQSPSQRMHERLFLGEKPCEPT